MTSPARATLSALGESLLSTALPLHYPGGKEEGTKAAEVPNRFRSSRGAESTLVKLLLPAGRAQNVQADRSTLRTDGCGPSCPVVWQGSSGLSATPHADSIAFNSGPSNPPDRIGKSQTCRTGHQWPGCSPVHRGRLLTLRDWVGCRGCDP